MIEEIAHKNKHALLISPLDARIYLVINKLASAQQKTLAALEDFSNVLTQAARRMLNCVVRARETEVVHVHDRLVFSAMTEIVHWAQNPARFLLIIAHFTLQSSAKMEDARIQSKIALQIVNYRMLIV